MGQNWLDLDVTIILLLFPHQVIRIEHLSPPNGLLGLISSSSSTAFQLGLDKIILFTIVYVVVGWSSISRFGSIPLLLIKEWHCCLEFQTSSIISGLIFSSCMHCNPLQGNYRVELLHREIPVIITGNEFAEYNILLFRLHIFPCFNNIEIIALVPVMCTGN